MKHSKDRQKVKTDGQTDRQTVKTYIQTGKQ